MAILFNADGEALNRIAAGAYLSNASNWSFALWFKIITNTPSGGRFRTFFQISDNTFTGNVFFGTKPNTNQLELYCSNGIDPDQTLDTTVLVLDTWYYGAVTYDATSHAFVCYLGTTATNLASVGTVTLDMSTITFDRQFISDEGTPSWSNDEASYYRDWQRKLTLAQLQAELPSRSAVLATNLFTDTPIILTSDITDHSGNGRDWTAAGSISNDWGPIFPSNGNNDGTDASVAIALTNGYSASISPSDAHFLWFSYTAIPGDTALDAFPWNGGAGSYTPTVRILNSDYTDYLGIVSVNRPAQFSPVIGNTYYIRVDSNTQTSSGTLAFKFDRGPLSAAPAGSILVPDSAAIAVVGRTYGGFPLAILGKADSLPLQFVDFPANSNGAATIMVDGTIAIIDGLEPKKLKIFDSQLTLIATYTHGTNLSRVVTDMSSRFYVAAFASTTIKAISKAGAVVGSWTLAVAPVRLGVSQDNTILYYSAGGASTSIRRWDLPNNIALSDLAAGVAGYLTGTDNFAVLSDGTIIVAYEQDVAPPRALFIRHYSTAGVILNTYTHADVFGCCSTVWMAIDDPNSFWLMTNSVAGADFGNTLFENIKVSDGSILESNLAAQYTGGTYQPAANATPTRFGHDFSCIMLILREALVPIVGVYSGVYKIVPNKTNDTVYTSIVPGSPPTFITADVKIP